MMDWESPCEAIIDGGSSELMEVLIKSMVAKVEGASMGTWLRDHDADRNETVQYKVFVCPAQLRTAPSNDSVPWSLALSLATRCHSNSLPLSLAPFNSSAGQGSACMLAAAGF